MLNFLFFLGVVVIPLSGIRGFGFMGETQHEASVYIFLPMLMLALPIIALKSLSGEGYPSGSFSRLNKITFIILGVLLLSFVFNFFNIMEAAYLGRHGIEKFIKSGMVVIYGIMLAYFSYTISVDKIRPLLMVPIAVSAALCCFYSFFEITSAYAGISKSIAEAISSIIHFDPGILSQRIRSLAYEPPALATYAAFAWPWLYAGLKSSRGPKKGTYAVLWIAMTILPLLAISRTGFVTIGAAFIELLLLNRVFLSSPPSSKALQRFLIWLAAGFVMLVIILMLVFFDNIKEAVIDGNSVSNLSRLASNVTAFSMMIERPLTGFGFGQYGFHALEFMPSWGFMSWEIRSWFSEGGISAVWPPVFSVYARFGAELGVPGLVLWVSLWLGLVLSILKAAQLHQRKTGEVPEYATVLILSCLTVLWTGIPLDSLRSPMIWITLGLSCRFLDSVYTKIKNLSEEETSPRRGKDLIFPASRKPLYSCFVQNKERQDNQ